MQIVSNMLRPKVVALHKCSDIRERRMSTYMATDLINNRLNLIPWSIIENLLIETGKHRVVVEFHLKSRDEPITQELWFNEGEVLKSSINNRTHRTALSMQNIRLASHVFANAALTTPIQDKVSDGSFKFIVRACREEKRSEG